MIIILTQSDPRTTRSQGPRTSSAFVLYKDLPLQYISTSKYVCLRSSRLFLLIDLIIYKLRLLLIPSETTTANRQSTHIVRLDACFLTTLLTLNREQTNLIQNLAMRLRRRINRGTQARKRSHRTIRKAQNT